MARILRVQVIDKLVAYRLKMALAITARQPTVEPQATPPLGLQMLRQRIWRILMEFRVYRGVNYDYKLNSDF